MYYDEKKEEGGYLLKNKTIATIYKDRYFKLFSFQKDSLKHSRSRYQFPPVVSSTIYGSTLRGMFDCIKLVG